ncbi:MAG: MFS transporter [Anaerolineales bacterium]|nr:MFS transporter [Anaerolineales bacterium]MCB8953573.1 MFS transporter [Ardenticatenales bacterium]
MTWFKTRAGLLWREMPAQYRANFIHLFLDIAWFGVLSGSAVAFISVYIVRLGGNGFQIGLVSAIPAIISIAIALPSGWWLNHLRIDKAVFWSSVLFRFFYLLWVPIPLLFTPAGQIWAFLVIILVMSLPGTMLAVGFNALFAAAVPPEWRGQVVGVRNALLAITFTLTSLLSGYLLSHLAFPLGYQVVFAIGFLGAAMSSLHLWRVRVPPPVGLQHNHRGLGDIARPGFVRSLGDTIRPAAGLRYLLERQTLRPPSLRVWRGAFAPVLLVLFAFHLTQYLAIPLFPLFWVERLQLTDQVISLGNAVFYVVVFLGSTQLGRISQRWGHHRVMVTGALVMSLYPFLTSQMRSIGLFLFTQVVGGVSWTLAGGALANYILEHIPDDDRPAHLAWYNMALNVAILFGSLVGPFVAHKVGLVTALAGIALLRLGSAVAIWRWGNGRTRSD